MSSSVAASGGDIETMPTTVPSPPASQLGGDDVLEDGEGPVADSVKAMKVTAGGDGVDQDQDHHQHQDQQPHSAETLTSSTQEAKKVLAEGETGLNGTQENVGEARSTGSDDTASVDSKGRENVIVEQKGRHFRDKFVKLIAPICICVFGWLCALAFLGGMIYQVTLDRSGFYFARSQNLHEWSYLGQTNPPSWGNVSSEFQMCAAGKMQSPVNIIRSLIESLEGVDNDTGKPFLGYILELEESSRVSVTWRDNSPFFQCLDRPCGSIQWNESIPGRFDVQEFVFRTQAEHSIRGASTGLELQLIANESIGDYNGSFVSSLFSSTRSALEGENGASDATRTLSTLFDILNTTNVVTVNLTTLFPPLNETGYYAYNGSMTYPPCFEGYRWFLSNSTVRVDNDLVRTYGAWLGYPGNYRNVQSMNGREIERHMANAVDI
ncbi:Carbonic anhydrase [Porphyridium purpureum]|uniref:Carbonic anhydrase n=1 Tax=Porphyridium purpureum TaxID=35688 RepID=A0A5J4YXX4_PORPP|nr:Carbonic anhydrase [Porphyridium purpureum]|eukprot:POR6497..scf209_3